MKFLDYIQIAFKNILRQKARTTLTVVAIVIGAMSVVIMLSLVLGAKKVMVKQIESIGGLTIVTVSSNPDMRTDQLITSGNDNPGGSKIIDDTVVNQFKSINNVVSATPTLGGTGKYMKIEGTSKKTWANVIGYDVNSQVFQIPILYGRSLISSDMDKVVVGVDMLKELGLGSNPSDIVGKHLIFILDGSMWVDWGDLPPKMPDGTDGKAWWEEQQKKTHEIETEIVGVTGGGTDSRQSFINLEWAKKLQTNVYWEWDNQQKDQKTQNSNSQMILKKEASYQKNGYGSVMLKVDKTDNVAAIADNLRKQGYGVATAEDMMEQISKVFTIVGLLAGAVGGISLFVAAIGIINTMIMATYERTREIGVMRACGATKKTIRRLFTFEAALLGFFGGVVGLITSFGLAQIANFFASKIAVSQSIPISGLITFPLWLILGTVGFTTLVGLLAGLYPAHRAAKLDPVEALRYE